MDDSSFANILTLAKELQQRDALTDVYLQPKEIVCQKFTCINQPEAIRPCNFKLNSLGFPAHQLLLASASPFFKMLFKSHYEEHKDSSICVMLPDVSALALDCILSFIYSAKLNIPTSLYEEVCELSHSLRIPSLSRALGNGKIIPMWENHSLFVSCPSISESTDARNTPNSFLHCSTIQRKNGEHPSNNIHTNDMKYNPPKIKDENVFRPPQNGVWYSPSFHGKFQEENVESQQSNSQFDSQHSMRKIDLKSRSDENKKFNIFNRPNEILLDYNDHSSTMKKEPLSSCISDLSHSGNSKPIMSPINMGLVCPTQHGSSLSTSPENFVQSPFVTNHHCLDKYNLEPQNGSKPLSQEEISALDEEGEEKFLKLQVLLKDCGEDYFRASTSIDPQNSPAILPNCPSTSKADTEGDKNISDEEQIVCETQSDELLEDEEPFLKLSAFEKNSTLENKLSCQYCSNDFYSLKEVKKHLLDAHHKVGFVCDICGKLFTKNGDLSYHKLRHNAPTLPCPICGKLFKLKKDLTAHRLTHSNPPKFECVKCGKLLTSKRNLQLHLDGVHKRRKPFSCSHCGKKYTKNVELMKHVRKAHTGERPYKCDVCNQSFYSVGSLYYHKDVHLPGVNFTCKSCPRVFKTRMELISHKRAHISKLKNMGCQAVLCNGGTENADVKNIKCRLCHGTFKDPCQFEIHMQKSHQTTVKVAKIKVKAIQTPSKNKVKDDPATNNSLSVDRLKTQAINGIPLNAGENKDSSVEDINLKVQPPKNNFVKSHSLIRVKRCKIPLKPNLKIHIGRKNVINLNESIKLSELKSSKR